MEDTADPVDTEKEQVDKSASEEKTEPQSEEQVDKPAGEEKAEPQNETANGAHGERPDNQASTAAEEPTAERPHRGKTLEQMMSLKEGDDERTQISKKISWILRHGARKVAVEIDVDGWVVIADILALEIMAGVTEEKLMDIIDESNQQKVRYEVKDADDDRGKAIRAVSKHTIVGMTSTVAREQRRIEREQRRDQRQEYKEAKERGEPLPEAVEGEARLEDPRIDDGPTYEQQLEDGYRPVYQANRIVAMVKEGVSHAVKPGRRTRPDYKGDFKGDFKGDYRSKGDTKGYGRDSKGYGQDFYRDNDSYGGYGYYRGSTTSDYRGSKGSKDGGKGYRDEKGYRDRGEDRRDYGRYGGGKGYGSDDTSYGGRVRWRVCPGQEAIVRASSEMESAAITTLKAGTLVYQTGEPTTNEHGIIRMPMETVEDGVRGWVTRTAEAANGPAFFRREGTEKGSGKGYDSERGSGKGYDGGYAYSGGKGKNSRGGKGGKGYYDGGGKGGKGRFDYGHF
mmetsp:Transcript_102310/g.161629  ORF Transcript_102310/g.161629 Transcript_102310/m.161629 type:complete len:509 (-) Transcript_102310:237-1763(-)